MSYIENIFDLDAVVEQMEKMKSFCIVFLLMFGACSSTQSSDEKAEANVLESNTGNTISTETNALPDQDVVEVKIEQEVEEEREKEAIAHKAEKKEVVVKESVGEKEKDLEEEKVLPVKEEKKERMKSETDIIKGKTDVIDPGLPRKDAPEENVSGPDHSDWDALLKKYVAVDGAVNYGGLSKEIERLNAYLQSLTDNPVDAESGQAEQMAYWINAYNAFTIKLILDNSPLKSIMDLDGGKVWDRKWIELAGKTLSLNDIEHVILRPTFKDPRIHFAVNCAAQSCPPIPNKAFTSENLNQLLEARTKSFINNAKYNKITSDQTEVSSIFDWYGEDFGDLISYLNKYSEIEIPAGWEPQFRAYDWSLNGNY